MPVITDPEVFPLHHETGAIGPVRPGGPAPGGIGRLEGDLRCIGRRAAAGTGHSVERIEMALVLNGHRRVPLVIHQDAVDDHFVTYLDVGAGSIFLPAEIQRAEHLELVGLLAVCGNVETGVAEGPAPNESAVVGDSGDLALHVHLFRLLEVVIGRPCQVLDGRDGAEGIVRIRQCTGAGRDGRGSIRRVPAGRVPAGRFARAQVLDQPGAAQLDFAFEGTAIAPDPDQVAQFQRQRGKTPVVGAAIARIGCGQAIHVHHARLVLQVEETIAAVEDLMDRADQLIDLPVGLGLRQELGNSQRLCLPLGGRLFPAGGQKGRHDHERKEQLLGFHFVPFINPSILRPIRVL